MSRKLARSALATTCLALGIYGIVERTPDRLPTSERLVTRFGPWRGLPVPLAWARIADAEESQNRRSYRSPAWLLSWLLPEEPSMLYELAWRRAYEDAALADDMQGQAAALLDGLAVLDLTARRPGERGNALAWQGFHLFARCGSLEGAEERRLAFQKLTGIDPLAMAQEKLREAGRASTEVDWARWLRAGIAELRASDFLAAGELLDAARSARAAAKIWGERKPARAGLLKNLATSLEADEASRTRDPSTHPTPESSTLSDEECARLAQDPIFGRKAGPWLRRFQEKRDRSQKRD